MPIWKASPQRAALTPRVLIAASDEAIEALTTLEAVTLSDDLRAYFRRVGGYDHAKCRELELFEPHLAWSMFALQVEDVPNHCGDLTSIPDNQDYFPSGFLPILWDGSGSYVAVNCIADSRTCGAVYDMSEGVGCNQISPSMAAFFEACTRETEIGLRHWESGAMSMESDNYLERAGVVFGGTPFFSRVGRMGSQIVDWR
jgi:hypothetical protein